MSLFYTSLFTWIIFNWHLYFHAVRADKNITIQVPSNFPTQYDPKELCTSASAFDIIVFFISNYVTHVGTVVTSPGLQKIHLQILTLLFPGWGFYSSAEMILKFARLEKNPVRRAVRAGVFYQVVRALDWTPCAGDTLKGSFSAENSSSPMNFQSSSKHTEGAKNVTASVKIKIIRLRNLSYFSDLGEPSVSEEMNLYGTHKLPEGYLWCSVGLDADICMDDKNAGGGAILNEGFSDMMKQAGSLNITKTSIAIFQLIYASYSLYQTRTDQLRKYGYAAFALTVVPFLVMTAQNLIALICTPEYRTGFVVRDDVLEEAERRGGKFIGTVGRLIEQDEEDRASLLPQTSYREGTREIVTFFKTDNGNQQLQPMQSALAQQGTPKTGKESQLSDVNLLLRLGRSNCENDSSSTTAAESTEFRVLDTKENSYSSSNTSSMLLQIPDRTNARPAPGDELLWRSYLLKIAGRYNTSSKGYILMSLILLVNSAIIVGIVAGISKFQPGESSVVEKFFILGWILTVPGFSLVNLYGYIPCESLHDGICFSPSNWFYIFAIVLGIGGYVIVGIQLSEFGVCSSL